MIEILDCTLRDGGYVNNWCFGENNIKEILNCLNNSEVKYIECGFLNENVKYNKNLSIFNKIEQFEALTEKCAKYALMINYGEYDIKKIPDNKNIILRIAFKKENINNALEYCAELKKRGYHISINPCRTTLYTNRELGNLIEKINDIKPYCFTIVDTMGIMKQNDVKTIFDFTNEKLDSKIRLGFHFHNNLQMAYANAQSAISMSKKRNIIIDSSLYGMGRGAGNLNTELIFKYLNKKNDIILDCIEKNIIPIFKKHPWGYSIPFYLSAINNCHPNYAKYLSDKGSYINMNNILKGIPKNKKSNYSESLIEDICKKSQ